MQLALIRIAIAAQLALGLVFLRSASGKARHPRRFIEGVGQYSVLPKGILRFVGAVLIPVEVVLAVGHLTGFLVTWTAALGFAMLVVFLSVVIVELRRGHHTPCMCFELGDHEVIGQRTVVRLLLMLAAEGVVVANGTPTGRLTFAEWWSALSLACAGLCAAFWLLRIRGVALLVRSRATA